MASIADDQRADDQRMALQFLVEQFLYDEAELLDDRRWTEWLALITEDIDYRIPVRSTRDRQTVPSDFSIDAFHIVEGQGALAVRLGRLQNDSWSENPPSRTRRVVSNVRIKERSEAGIAVRSNLLFYWERAGQSSVVAAERRDLLRPGPAGLRLCARLVLLDHTVLPTPSLSVVL